VKMEADLEEVGEVGFHLSYRPHLEEIGHQGRKHQMTHPVVMGTLNPCQSLSLFRRV
jgi:hypothetical protein